MKFCIDTNIFFSFQKGINLGGNPLEVVESFASAAAGGHEFFVTPSVVGELNTMLQQGQEDVAVEFLKFAKIKSPNVYNLSVPAGFLYDYIADVRARNVLGIKIAEELIEATAVKFSQNPQTQRIELQKSLKDIKSNYRERFKNATRTGTIDSQADLDLILLALELECPIVTADDGLLVWARKLGAAEADLTSLSAMIKK